MNTPNHATGQYMKGVRQAIGQLAPLQTPKDPILAAVAGFCGGAFGILLYLQSLKDFLLCFGLCFFFLLCAPFTFGMSILVAALFCAAYGYHRARTSNEKLIAQRTNVVNVSAVPPAPPVVDLAKMKPANVSCTEMKLNKAKDLLGKGLIAQSEYESIRAKILSEI